VSIVTVNTVTVNTDLDTALLEIIRDATGLASLAYARRPKPLTGGFWAELVAFSLADPPPGWPAELVARIMPDEAVARKETIVQAAVAAAGFPTPAVRVSGGPGCRLGRAFMVMDRAPGTGLLSGLGGAAAVTAVPHLIRRLPAALASAMAELHALDPASVRDQLSNAGAVAATIPALLDVLSGMAVQYQRDDLRAAARWLISHPPAWSPEVICHGDLHPFNLLATGRHITVLDWSTALLAPRAYDVAFTTLMLSEPPLQASEPVLRLARLAGRRLARRFARRYQARAGVTLSAADLRWHQAIVCLRALTEVAGWVADGTISHRAGHPWLVSGPTFAARLRAVTGIPVRPR
jgi:aminoglycoside phosphotransferase (APT) family kinase protein